VNSRTRSLVFWSAAALIAAETVLFGLVVPALPRFAERLDLSDPQIALIFALFPLGQLAAAVVGGALLERTGRRPAMLGSLVLLAVATIGFAYADSVSLFAGTRFLQGVAAGFAWTGALAAISDVYPAGELGFRMSLAEAAGGAGGIAGPALGGIGIDTIGLTETFLVAALVPLVLAIPLLLAPETRRPGAGAGTPRLAALRTMLRTTRAQVAAVALLAFAVVLGLIEPLLPLDLDRRLGASAAVIGGLFAALIIAHLIVAPLAGRWSDRRGRVGPLLAGGIVLALALPMTAIGPLWFVMAAMVLVGVGLGALGAGVGALMTEAVDEVGLTGQYSLSAGSLTALFSIGALLGPVLGGGARLVLTYLATVVLLALAVLAATTWAALALRGVERQRPGEIPRGQP
jgi:DHA1 family solute carrier family 18 vesicular amine transporter 1/2